MRVWPQVIGVVTGRRVVRGGMMRLRYSVTMQITRIVLLVMIGAMVITGLEFRFRWGRSRWRLIHIFILYNYLWRIAVLIFILVDDLFIVILTKVVLILIVLKQKGVLIQVNN